MFAVSVLPGNMMPERCKFVEKCRKIVTMHMKFPLTRKPTHEHKRKTLSMSSA